MEHLAWTVTPEGLVFTIGKEPDTGEENFYAVIEEIKDKEGNFGDEQAEALLWEYFENDIEAILPQDINGALTSSPIVRVEDQIFWFPNYAVESMVSTLLEKGRVVMTKG